MLPCISGKRAVGRGFDGEGIDLTRNVVDAGPRWSGRAAIASIHGSGRADAPDADSIPELHPAMCAGAADALPHTWAGAAATALAAAAAAASAVHPQPATQCQLTNPGPT